MSDSAGAVRDGKTPRHLAVIMDGNGRWAQNRRRPRAAGHRAGVKATKRIVRLTRERGIPYLTLFAFSSENWYRPEAEVGLLMDLFLQTLRREVKDLRSNDVRIRFIGEHQRFPASLRREMDEAEALTEDCEGLNLTVAVGYGGRWDLVNAMRELLRQVKSGRLSPKQVSEEHLTRSLSLSYAPDPDLFVRTGGECRISNFLLWNLAYTELYFTEALWPDFDAAALDAALAWFASRQRRFGRVPGQADKATRSS